MREAGMGYRGRDRATVIAEGVYGRREARGSHRSSERASRLQRLSDQTMRISLYGVCRTVALTYLGAKAGKIGGGILISHGLDCSGHVAKLVRTSAAPE